MKWFISDQPRKGLFYLEDLDGRSKGQVGKQQV
jgi:hypothetical protein